jgi:hypothetical protein
MNWKLDMMLKTLKEINDSCKRIEQMYEDNDKRSKERVKA